LYFLISTYPRSAAGSEGVDVGFLVVPSFDRARCWLAQAAAGYAATSLSPFVLCAQTSKVE
jgi:hypothetical protein